MNDLYQTQIDMERVFAKNQLMYRIKQEYLNAGAELHLANKGIPIEFGIALMIQMYLHKRTTVGVLVGILYRHFEEEANPFQACADMLIKAAEADIVDYSSIDGRFIVKPNLMLDQAVQDELAMFQYPLPMVVEPEEITHNKQSGYLTVKGSVILKDNHHDDDVVLEHLNEMNKIRLCMNEHTVAHVQNQWRNMAKPKDGEDFEAYKKRVAAFDKFDKVSRDVLETLFMLGNVFYLTHKYDKRGRTYCQGYHCNYQSNDWCKSVIEFADKELCK